MPQPIETFVPGEKVVVTQQIPQRDEVWTTQVVGRVVRAEQLKTGSWFAHAKDDKLWLDRLTLRKEDGELVVVNLDPYTHVERLEGPPEPAPATPPPAETSADAAQPSTDAPADTSEAASDTPDASEPSA